MITQSAPTTPVRRPALLRIKEVARILSVSPRTVWRWISLGKLPRPVSFSKVCKRWVESQLDEAILKMAQVQRDGLDDHIGRPTQARGE